VFFSFLVGLWLVFSFYHRHPGLQLQENGEILKKWSVHILMRIYVHNSANFLFQQCKTAGRLKKGIPIVGCACLPFVSPVADINTSRIGILALRKSLAAMTRISVSSRTSVTH
jgi:hypothetical protein